jgi:hypothetical protein
MLCCIAQTISHPKMLEAKSRKKFHSHCEPKFMNIYTIMKFLLVIYTESVVVSCCVCVCVVCYEHRNCVGLCV